MSYLTAWAGLDSANKQARIDGAALWLDARYVWPGVLPDGSVLSADLHTPQWGRVASDGSVLKDKQGRDLVDVPLPIKTAELIAARYALTAPLYIDTQTTGAITAFREKVEGIEEETEYAEAKRDENGLVRIGEVDALLASIVEKGSGDSIALGRLRKA